MDDEKVKAELLKHNIDWIRNPATASNFEGVWERQIWSVLNVIAALLKQHGHSLDDESLQTLLCEAEAVVNSRPLTTEILSGPLSPLPLTPSALLTGKTKLIIPPPGKTIFTASDAGGVYSILLMSFGTGGVKNTCRAYS